MSIYGHISGNATNDLLYYNIENISVINNIIKKHKIDELNKGLQEFHSDVSKDSTSANRLEISIIEFASDIKCIQEPALVGDFVMPTLSTRGTTKMIDALDASIDKINARKDWYKKTGQPYYRPWIILITDGYPDGGQDIDGMSKRINNDTNNNSYLFPFVYLLCAAK